MSLNISNHFLDFEPKYINLFLGATMKIFLGLEKPELISTHLSNQTRTGTRTRTLNQTPTHPPAHTGTHTNKHTSTRSDKKTISMLDILTTSLIIFKKLKKQRY